MLTRKQQELLLFIHDNMKKTGIPPSFEEMKDALDLASKSGIHRLITALEERGFIRRLPNRARALEVIRLPPGVFAPLTAGNKFLPSIVNNNNEKINRNNFVSLKTFTQTNQANKKYISPNNSIPIPLMGRIAAGVPISAIKHKTDTLFYPSTMLGKGEHYALEVKGDSMINTGILDNDIVIIQRTEIANPGEIIVALVDDLEATLKRYRRKGDSIALEAANPTYETRIFGPGRVKIQGRLVGLLRQY